MRSLFNPYDECGITFTTLQDKEEHMKLEHKEGKGPTGVS
jgi:hypothetical protein